MEFKAITAYLDPGTGSLILQAVLGGFAGLAVLLRAGRRRIFQGRRPGEEAAGEPAAQGDSTPAHDE